MFDRRLRDGIREMSGVINVSGFCDSRNECRSLSLMSVMAVNSGKLARPLAAAPPSLTTLQPFKNLVGNAMNFGSKVLVKERRPTMADDHITIGSIADRCQLSGVKQTSHFKGVRTGFDPTETFVPRDTGIKSA
jgi:hypothetical protein